MLLLIEGRDLWKEDRTRSYCHFRNDAAASAGRQGSGSWLLDTAVRFPGSTLQVAAVPGDCAVAAAPGSVTVA